MDLARDKRIVLTLDGGGTNFTFSAIRGKSRIVDDFCLPSRANVLEDCLATIIEGFTHVSTQLKEKASAISFAFPGPADYELGIIGDLTNLPAFRDGVKR